MRHTKDVEDRLYPTLRADNAEVVIYPWDRKYGALLIGGQGCGKTSALLSLYLNDIEDENAAPIVIDPKSELSRICLRMTPPACAKRVWFLDLGRPAFGMSPLRVIGDRPLAIEAAQIAENVVAALLDINENQIYQSSRRYLYHAVIGAIAIATKQGRRPRLEDVYTLLRPAKDEFRSAVAEACADQPDLDQTAEFFRSELPDDLRMATSRVAERLDAPRNKISGLTGVPPLRRFFNHPSDVPLREIIQDRDQEGLSTAEIARRLGRAEATIKTYLYDPTGDKARAVKARYQGVCRGCGAYTQPRNGKGDAYAYCKACHPGAIERRWTPRRVIDAMLVWRALRTAAVVLRLVAHARATAWGRCARAARGKRVAISERRYPAVRNMGRRLRSGAASRGGRPSETDLMRSQRFCRFGSRRRSGSRLSGLRFGDLRGSTDPGQETSRGMTAGPRISRTARRGSYTRPTESGSSGATARSTCVSTTRRYAGWRNSGLLPPVAACPAFVFARASATMPLASLLVSDWAACDGGLRAVVLAASRGGRWPDRRRPRSRSWPSNTARATTPAQC